MPIGRRTFVKGLAALTLTGCAKPPTSPEDPLSAPPSLPTEGFTLIGAGDIGDCSRDGAERTARIADSLLKSSERGAVYLHTFGDNAYPDGSKNAFEQCFAPTWGQFRSIIRPAVGNHDVDLPGVPYYFSYFPNALGNGKDGYYSYTEGQWLVVVLNSELLFSRRDAERATEQLRFLRERLAAHAGRFVAAIWHRPRFAHGRNVDSPEVGQFLNELHASGKSGVTLHGHEHYYERFLPERRVTPERVTEFRSFTVGTGGAELYQFKGIRQDIVEFRHQDAKGVAAGYGVIRFRLRPTGYSWEYWASLGPGSAPMLADSGAQAFQQ